MYEPPDSPAACPVSDLDRDWLEGRMAWLAEEFGWEPLRVAQVVLPTHEFFPDPFDHSPDSARLMLDRVCGYMGVEPRKVELAMFRESSLLAGDQAAGLYEPGADGRSRVWVEEFMLLDPHALAATLAHEVGHFLLLGQGRITADHEDHEPLTDLLTVFLGMGVLRANATIRDRTFRMGAYSANSMRKYGYLTMPQYGYALALFAHARAERGPAWAKELRADVRAAFDQGVLHLEEQENFHWRPLHLEAKPRLEDAAENFADGRARCTYCGVEIAAQLVFDDLSEDDAGLEPTGESAAKRSELGVCRACRESIEENHRELEEQRRNEERGNKFLFAAFRYMCLGFGLLVLVALIVGLLYEYLQR